MIRARISGLITVSANHAVANFPRIRARNSGRPIEIGWPMVGEPSDALLCCPDCYTALVHSMEKKSMIHRKPANY